MNRPHFHLVLASLNDPHLPVSDRVRKKLRVITRVAIATSIVHGKATVRFESMLNRLFPKIGDLDRETLAAMERLANAAQDIVGEMNKALVRSKSRADLVAWIDIMAVQMHASAAQLRRGFAPKGQTR